MGFMSFVRGAFSRGNNRDPTDDTLRHSWNAFDVTVPVTPNEVSSGSPLHRAIFGHGVDKTIVSAIYNRIAMDAASVSIKHVQLDEKGRFKEELDTGINRCFNYEANIDQSGRAFLQDVYASLLDEGCVAIVPVVTDLSPERTGGYDIFTMRTGKVLQWYPNFVEVEVYNEETGLHEKLTLSKKYVCLPENPLYAVINDRQSVTQRLIRKLTLLDAIDEQVGSGKMDLIIQLPYLVKTDARKTQAEERRKLIEEQLVGSKYGIAYIDGTERITQLNRPVENNLMNQIEYLTSMLYSQLGLTQEIMNGTASETAMLNYYNRTIEPLVSVVVDEGRRKFLTKTARTQGKSLMSFRDPFRLIPVEQLAELADKLTRNEIMSPNEIRQIIGLKPSEDPASDQLANRNLVSAESRVGEGPADQVQPVNVDEEQIQNG